MSFRGEICAAIASAKIAKERKITYSGGGLTPGDAERLALGRCNADRRARGSCQLRTTVCGDGRSDSTAHATEAAKMKRPSRESGEVRGSEIMKKVKISSEPLCN